MTRTLTNHTIFIRLSHAWVFALLLGAVSGITLAQGPPPNMDFTSGSGSTSFNSAGNALRGNVTGSVFGRIRNGAVTQLDMALDPVVDGGAGHVTYFRLDLGDQIGAYWYTVSNGKKLVLTNVPAREWIRGYTPQSVGVATLELTFVNNGPGRAVVKDYRHLRFAGPTPRPYPFRG